MFHVDIPRGLHQLTIIPTIIRHYDNNDNGEYNTTYEFVLDNGLTDGMYTANALAFVTIENIYPTNVYSSLIYTVPTGSGRFNFKTYVDQAKTVQQNIVKIDINFRMINQQRFRFYLYFAFAYVDVSYTYYLTKIYQD